jgi:hypothetical protein
MLRVNVLFNHLEALPVLLACNTGGEVVVLVGCTAMMFADSGYFSRVPMWPNVLIN